MDGFLKPNDKMLKRHRRSVFLDNKINLTFNASSNNPNGLIKQGNVVDKKVLSQVRVFHECLVDRKKQFSSLSSERCTSFDKNGIVNSKKTL